MQASEETELDPTHSNLIVNYLPLSYRERHIRKIFASCGHINSCRVMRFAQDGRTLSKGYGFVEFSNRAEAELAVRTLNGKNVLGKKLKVSFAKPSGQRVKSNLFVNQIPVDWTEKHLEQMFGQFGQIIERRILRNLDGSSRKSAFVRFDSNDQACKAIKTLHNQKPMPTMTEPMIVRVATDVDSRSRSRAQRTALQTRKQKQSSQPTRTNNKMPPMEANSVTSERSSSHRSMEPQRKPSSQQLTATTPFTPAEKSSTNYVPLRRIEHPLQGCQDSRGHFPAAPPTDKFPIPFERPSGRIAHPPMMRREQTHGPWRDPRPRRAQPRRNEIDRFYPNDDPYRREIMGAGPHYCDAPARPHYQEHSRWHAADRKRYSWSRYNLSFGGHDRGRSRHPEDVEFSYTRTPSPASCKDSREETNIPKLYNSPAPGREVMFTHFPAFLDETAFQNMCNAYGEIEFVHVDKDLNGLSIGVAKVIFRDVDAVAKAVQAFNGCSIGGMEIRCSSVNHV